MNELLYALWLFLPAGVANMVPTIVWRVPGIRAWNTPVDFGKSFRGVRALGPNKTWRGIVCGVIAGVIVFALQQRAASELGSFGEYLQQVEYTTLPPVYGFLLGLGALAGDVIESFIKRQRHIAAGRPWFPFDQLDYIIGACLLTLPIYTTSIAVYLLIFLNWFALHLIFSAIGYGLKFKKALI